MGILKLHDALKRSLKRQEAVLRGSLVLNPVENFPFPEDITPASGPLHGLYNTDKLRSDRAKRDTIHQFSGRNRLAYDSRQIYAAWARELGATDVSMRLLSGLQAHTAIFMAITKPGDCVLLLPEIAGGHMSTKGILERLSLEIIEMEIDNNSYRVDVAATLKKIKRVTVDFIFIDRSEGLVYEDFSELIERAGAPAIFDGSQYLTHILAGDYLNPFDMGAGLFISTVHKNFPGPQKALVATRKEDTLWAEVRSGLSAYVSNMHITSTYAAGLTLARTDWISEYSKRMLKNTVMLDCALTLCGIPTVSRPSDAPPTHHIWIGPLERNTAFDWFKRLERARIHVNYRLLPYGIGYGLRLGLAALTRLGLTPNECSHVAQLIYKSIYSGAPTKQYVRRFSEELWERTLK